MTKQDPLARRRGLAARNNAEWCDIVCRSHGIPGHFGPDAWVNPRRTPHYYPDAVTLRPAASGEAILGRIDTTSPGPSIKDSFATLDLQPFGFEVVHEAEWIHRGTPSSRRRVVPDDMRWTAIETAGELAAWAAAWDGHGAPDGLFRPALFREQSVTILGGYLDGTIVAGAITNRTGKEVVGLSNVFANDGDPDRAWRGSLGYLDTALPGVAIVGYEAGSALSVALCHGFEAIGPLRIWLRELERDPDQPGSRATIEFP